jgi:anti-sigma-K factor RskA
MLNHTWRSTREWRLALTVLAIVALGVPVAAHAALGITTGPATAVVASDQGDGSVTDDTPWD